MKRNLKRKIPYIVFERWIVYFRSYKNHKLNVKLWWVWACKRENRAVFVLFFCLTFTVYYVLSQCIVYWIHFENIHTFMYQKVLLLIIFYLFSKLLKAISVSLRTDILLHRIKKHYFILIINQFQSIKTMYFKMHFIYTIKWGWYEPIFGLFHDLLTHCNHSTTWHPEYITLSP